ncbi:hypothetical protein EW026_g3177 [Hermanssonia centrifuga]|uniref:Helicase C-terminal domain-containing protein n=1 Tax=Hermanssonia centrifuga TaxID=98765 RepID=A0A4S4KKY9_9APHY|nr:hypothetical protein EW026_g3177 [Hermanssonia centrifuga]
MVARILKEKLLPKYFLRRTKSLIKDQLPNKYDQVVFCPLTKMQIKAYKQILETEAVYNMIHKDEKCDCGSKETFYMSTLIKISNHLALILPSPSDTPDQTMRNRELCEQAFPNGNAPRYGPAMLRPEYCGKWLVLEALLKEWRKDRTNKVLIFTKSVKLLEMLEYHLNAESLGFVKLDGSTKQAARMPIIDEFHEDPDKFVFLISTLAGGTGLNLTGANKVVIFDPNWNPAHDLQAMDRAYRYGQTRDVEVFRLLGAGSLEELIYARQVYKQQQMAVGYNASLQTRYFEGVQGDKAKQGELFGVRNIFRLHEDALATKQTIERANMLDLDWALANMDAKKGRHVKTGGAEWVYEAEAKGKKDYGDLRGLGALLFDDEVAPKVERESDIQKTLNDIGVNYTHRNEDLIVENVIEGQRIKAMIKEKRMKTTKTEKKTGKVEGKKDKSPEPQWPPKRKHHKPPPGPQEKLAVRREALIELGMISGPADLSTFAQELTSGRKSKEEQAEILARLDRQAKKSLR